LTGKTWASTTVVPSIWDRINWSLEKMAVGDAVQAFISQRITQIPFNAGITWWVLWTARLLVWYFVICGFWYLHRHPWHLFLLLGVILYIIILPGPIAHDRFYLPAVPVVSAVTALGFIKRTI
jgi:hypothetical protein